jgi:lipopolysaccharide export system protein LptA
MDPLIRVSRFFLLLVLAVLFTTIMQAQTEDSPPSKAIDVLSMRKSVRQVESDRTIDFFYGDVVLKQDQTYIYCDSATMEGKIVYAWGNVVIRQGETTTIFSDILRYDGNTRLAELDNNVVLQSEDKRLHTQRLIYDAFNKIATYTQGATLNDGNTKLKSKRGKYYVQREDVYFMDQVEVSDPEFRLKTDSMRYSTDSKITHFLMPTIIQFDTSKIYTESGYYNIERRLAYFDKNPQYTSGQKKAKARVIEYDGREGITRLIDEAWFEEESTNARADTMILDSKKDEFSLFGNAIYKTPDQEFTGDQLVYNRNTKQVRSSGRSRVIDGNQILESSSLDFDDASGIGIASGMVIWQDTKEGITIYAEQLEQNKASAYVKAYGGRPLLIVSLDNKNLYIAGDTLLSFKVPTKPVPAENSEAEGDFTASDEEVDLSEANSEDEDESAPMVMSKDTVSTLQDVPLETKAMKSEDEPSVSDIGEQPAKSDEVQIPLRQEALDSIRLMVMHGNVHIYREDMRGLCDSLVFHSVDSLFTLFGDPYMWSDSTQFSGDTIVLAAKNGKLDEMRILTNALVILTDDGAFYDQISGKTLQARFEQGKAEEVLVSGNAQTVYYVKNEEKAYTGVNVKKAGKMRIWFEDNTVRKVRFYSQPDGEFLPMGQTDHEAIRLSGFVWRMEERPESPEFMTDLKWINWEALLRDQNEILPADGEEPDQEEAPGAQNEGTNDSGENRD